MLSNFFETMFRLLATTNIEAGLIFLKDVELFEAYSLDFRFNNLIYFRRLPPSYFTFSKSEFKKSFCGSVKEVPSLSINV